MEEQFRESNYGFLIEITMKKIRQSLQRQLSQRGYEITVDQWVIIDQLAKEQPMTQRVLGEKTSKDAPTITRIIDLLVKKGLLRRQPSMDDRRIFSIHLTKEGEALHKKVLPVVIEVRSEGWKGLSGADFDHLRRILGAVYTNMSETDMMGVVAFEQ